MPVDDLWYLKKRGPNKERIPSQRHGRGKRWRVRNDGAATVLFDKKPDAERYDANVRADLSRGQYIDPKAGTVTVAEYCERWRGLQLHRPGSAERAERIQRLHINLLLGEMEIGKVRTSHIKNWVKDRSEVLAPATLRSAYFGYLVPMFAAAVLDRVIGATPCVGIRLPELDRGEYVIASAEQVHILAEALPERFRAVPLTVAGCGPRASEVFGLEEGDVVFLKRELRIRQQVLRLAGEPAHLGPPKTKTSKRAIELASVVGDELARHIECFPPVDREIEDRSNRTPVVRPARLLFTQEDGLPMTRSIWSKIWQPAAKAAGLPTGFGLRDLRHYFATVLIYGGANVKTVQLAMGHTTPTTTLNIYVGYWPDALDRTRSLIDAALGASLTSRHGAV